MGTHSAILRSYSSVLRKLVPMGAGVYKKCMSSDSGQLQVRQDP